jgi:hypothetical protein
MHFRGSLCSHLKVTIGGSDSVSIKYALRENIPSEPERPPQATCDNDLGTLPPQARLADWLVKSAASPRHDRWSNSHQGLALHITARRLKYLVGDFVPDIFVSVVEFGGEVGAVVHGDYSSSLVAARVNIRPN